VPLGAGVPLERRHQRGVSPLNNVILQIMTRRVWKRLQISTDMLLIITSTGDRLFRFINIDDLKLPWTPLPLKNRVYSKFFTIFGCSAHFTHWIATKWLEIDQDNLRMKFSALNVDFSSLSPDPLGSWSPAQAGVKDGYPLKSDYLQNVLYCAEHFVKF